MRDGCHVFAANQELLAEWKKHYSNFSRGWLFAMVRAGKLKSLPAAADRVLWTAFGGEDCPEADYRNISKDLHLVDAALRTDRRVASRDDVVRRSLNNCLDQHPPVGDVAWVNPTAAAETPLDWLRQGAPLDAGRLLKNLPPPVPKTPLERS